MNPIITETYAYFDDGAKQSIKVHTFTTGADSYRTNAFVIETSASFVVIDALMTISDASQINAFASSRGKAIVGIAITHPHPDHYAGAGVLKDAYPNAKIISTLAVKQEIERIDPLISPAFAEKYGENWPASRPLPNVIVEDGKVIRLGGLAFKVREYGVGESDWDTVWFLNAATQLAFVGDMVFGDVHSYMADGYSNKWLAALEILKNDINDETFIYTGHGRSGNGLALIRKQTEYLHTYRNAVAELLDEFGEMNTQAQQILENSVKMVVDNDLLKEFIIGGCEAVAKEILQERQLGV